MHSTWGLMRKDQNPVGPLPGATLFDVNTAHSPSQGFPESSVGKESACNAGGPGSIPGSRRSGGEGTGSPLQNSWVSLVAQFSSVAQSYPTLCDPIDCSMPGFPVHHQCPELTQIHVHQVGDAIHLLPQLVKNPSATRKTWV